MNGAGVGSHAGAVSSDMDERVRMTVSAPPAANSLSCCGRSAGWCADVARSTWWKVWWTCQRVVTALVTPDYRGTTVESMG